MSKQIEKWKRIIHYESEKKTYWVSNLRRFKSVDKSTGEERVLKTAIYEREGRVEENIRFGNKNYSLGCSVDNFMDYYWNGVPTFVPDLPGESWAIIPPASTNIIDKLVSTHGRVKTRFKNKRLPVRERLMVKYNGHASMCINDVESTLPVDMLANKYIRMSKERIMNGLDYIKEDLIYQSTPIFNVGGIEFVWIYMFNSKDERVDVAYILDSGKMFIINNVKLIEKSSNMSDFSIMIDMTKPIRKIWTSIHALISRMKLEYGK